MHLENEANADDAANDGVGGRDGQTHARGYRQPDRGSHHGSHETEGKGLRQIVELLRIGHLEFEIDRQDAFSDGFRHRVAGKERACELKHGRDDDRLFQGQRS